jgi:hypothetical protein
MVGKIRSTLSAFTLGIILLTSARPADADTILRCVGFNRELNDTIEHHVTIGGTTATVDGIEYTAKATQVFYILRRTGSSLTINRTTGSYVFADPENMAAGSPDWSRPNDAGCMKTKPRF